MNQNPSKSKVLLLAQKNQIEKSGYEPFSKKIKLQNGGYHSKLEKGNQKIAAMTKKVSRNRSSKNIFESEDKTKTHRAKTSTLTPGRVFSSPDPIESDKHHERGKQLICIKSLEQIKLLVKNTHLALQDKQAKPNEPTKNRTPFKKEIGNDKETK